jgi:TonB family protein
MKESISLNAVFMVALLALAGCGAGNASTGASAAPTNAQQYAQAVSDAAAKSTKLPPSLAGSGVSGTAHVQIILAPDGSLISAAISQSSGTTGLDNIALSGVEDAHFPVLPASLPQQAQQFDIPVNFGPPHPAS